MTTDGANVELREYLRILRRRWLLIAGLAAVTVGAAAAYTFTATPMYESSARLFVSTTSESEAIQAGVFSTQRVTSYADLVQGESLARAVSEDLDLRIPPKELAGKVEAEVTPETVNLVVRARDSDPEIAKSIAQSYAVAIQDLVDVLETPPGSTTPLLKVTIVDPASAPDGTVSPKPFRNLGLGLIIGLILGIGAAVLRELLDTTVKSFDDVSDRTDAPLLGSIAYDPATRARPLVSSLDSHAPRVEAFRVLRTNIQFIDVDHPSKVFVVTSALPAEGKTTTAVNLALTLAQAGGRTLLIECDLRRPRATAALEMDNAVGVTTVLVGKVSLDDAVQKDGDSGLHVLGSGSIPPNPAELLQSRAMADLLSTARERYDTVIIDAPPLLPVTDAALLASQADGAIVVLRWGKTTRDQVAGAVERLRSVGAQPLGIVLNMVPSRRSTTGYGYGYGYGYGPSEGANAVSSKTSRRFSRASKNTD